MDKDVFGITKLYPTAGGGKEWFSNWIGDRRWINNDTYDAKDSDFGALAAQNRINKISVSCAECNVKTFGEYRLFVNGPWTNTEMTVFIKIKDTTTTSIQMRSRSNHFGIGLEPFAGDALFVAVNPQGVSDYMSCGFGNYLVRWGQSNPLDFVDIGVEIIHELYKLDLATVDPFVIPTDVWIGYKQTTRTLANGHVKVEGWNNMNGDKVTWTKTIEFEFDGTNATIDSGTLSFWSSFTSYCATRGDMISGDINAHQIWTNPGKWCYLRLNGPSKMDLRYFSVREIVPF